MSVPVRPTALARVGGLPVRLWLAAADSRLATAIHDLEERSRAHHARTTVLAEVIGTDLVPHPALSAAERALALKVRRALHKGVPVANPDSAALVDLARRVGARDDLVRGLLDAATRGAELAEAERAADESLAAELERLPRFAWDLVRESVPAHRALRHNNPATYHDIDRRVRRGERWTGKRLRRESEYLWRMIERGTTKPTPRGWFGQIGLVDVDDRDPTAGPELVLGPDVTAYAVDNVYTVRGFGSDPSAWVALTPLRLTDDEYLWVWADNPEHAGRFGSTELVEIKLRRTKALDALLSMDRAGPVADAVDRLLPVAGAPANALAFLKYLAGKGVLTVTRPPTTRRVRGRYAAADGFDGLDGGPDSTADQAFLDVYRPVRSPIGSGWYRRVEDLFALATRVGALVTADQRDQRDDPPDITDRPRPVLDLVFGHLRNSAGWDDPPALHAGWPVPALADSGYAVLYDTLTSATTAVADISTAFLDDLRAPPAGVDWPVDAIVRPLGGGAGPLAVLGRAAPAGVLAARFADLLTRTRDRVPGLSAYRDTLRRIEDETGGLFVEMLLPPVSAIAANAVRRPVYTRAWTGDPDPRPYHGSPPPDYQYVPLSDITLRRCGGTIIAEAAGRRIWPMYHATRTLRQRWKILYRHLMAASPQTRYWPESLSAPGALLANRDATPRVTLDGSLVLTPAAWRIDRTGLWDADAPALAKARALDRLRYRLGLPRWVFVTGAPGGALACDLDSARAVGVTERAAGESPDGVIVIEEMLPDPERFVTGDGARPVPDRFATELLLRFPVDEPPATTARRVAHELASGFSRETGLLEKPHRHGEEVTHESPDGQGSRA